MKKRYSEFVNDQEIAHLESYLNIDKYSDFMNFYFKEDQKVSDKSFNLLLERISTSTVSILEYVEVNSSHRSKNIGNKLLSQLIDESVGDVILICDITEDFVFQWYERYGFQVIHSKGSEQFHVLPIMIFYK